MGLGAGQIVLDTDLAAIVAGTTDKPIGRLVASGTQALADNTRTSITFTAEEIDTDGFHSTSVNTSRITPTKAGYYRFYGTVFFEAQTTPSISDCNFRKNGTTSLAPAGRAQGYTQAFSLSTTCVQDFNGTTDYIELQALQDSAGADNTNQSVQFSSVVEWEFVRDL